LNRPKPPPLLPKDQREFEELVRAAASTNSALHPDARRPPPPEFEGDTNPVTGEVGGPKREPLRHGDWSYSGRTSDF
ncbi:uncharacterized protein FOMMEDRAFT_65032, partial [Fomitiporia mediterranea MF3/22]|uniref:uncharacterized protein n=1 Tax=Fomitiporia mediterranea (strain MF3/22) TaxID=694068 RepID=UPI0004407AA1